MSITKTLAKAKMEQIPVKLQLRNGATYDYCKVIKLMGTEIEVNLAKKGYSKIMVNDLVSVEIVKEKQDA